MNFFYNDDKVKKKKKTLFNFEKNLFKIKIL